jgi:hypothetical protein
MKLAPLALLAVLAACQIFETEPVDPDTARREAHLRAHPETRPEVAAAIRAGDLVVGMGFPGEVEASVGSFPDFDVEIGMGGVRDMRFEHEGRMFVLNPNSWMITEILYPEIHVPGVRWGTLDNQ